jgi:hypothetical protein
MINRIATMDAETDPFEFGVIVQPFLFGYHDGQKTVICWGDDCIPKMIAALEKEREPLTIFVHNGGRFDFWYLLPYLTPGSIKIINGRIVQAMLGKHELRDSFAIMPFPLAEFNKDQIDYELFRREKREAHKEEIIRYWTGDLVYLHMCAVGFIKEFGDKLTVGGASLKQLKQFHKFSCGNENYDKKFRDRFYFGGRNQVFKSGILKGPYDVYDVNSMYPYVMRNFLHPIGTGVSVDKRVRPNTCFLVVEGWNYGAFPTRTDSGGLDFTVPYGTFHPTIHEWQAALDTGTFRPKKIIKTYGWDKRGTFEEFVNHFYDLRAEYKAKYKVSDDLTDKMYTLFYKYVLNSAYGKFAQNPENYFNYEITCGSARPSEWHDCTESCEPECKLVWTASYIHDKYIIWQRPTRMHHYYNVATGCSITGAARSVLLRGIHAATDPIYCDTDSIICRSLESDQISDSQLGGWKLEATATTAAICGKKLYALFDESETCIKKAHKGARLSGPEILRIAKGETVGYDNPVPSFSFDGTASFIHRDIRRTA